VVLRAREGFSFDHAGVPVVVTPGELFENDHPWVKGHESFFEQAEDAVTDRQARPEPMETATSVPGERRQITRAKAARRGED
jgi:hypothetical protein